MTDQRVIDTVESLIHNTTGRIKDVQSNLIPFYNTGVIKHVNSYRMYNVPYMAESDYQTIILVSDLKFKNSATPQKYRGVWKARMRDVYLNNVIHPFLLFVNGKFVKWSNIEIVNDVHYTYIIANNVYYPDVEKIDIIQIPFNIFYNENGNITENTKIMFRFDENGLLSDIGETIISYDETISDIHMDSFDAPLGNIRGWDILNIKDNIKLFPENLIIFKNGLLYRDANIVIDPMNVLSIDNGESKGMVDGRAFYDINSNIPKNNVYQFHGNDYISELMKNAQLSEPEDVPYYVTKLREDFNFDFEYSIDKSYEQNILDSINYIYNYNPQLLYPAHTSPIIIRSWTGKQVKELLDENSNLVMIRDKYDNHQTYILPFLNGELYKYHDQIIYNLSTFTLPIYGELADDDLLEIIYFKNVDNATIIGHVTQEDPLVSLDGYIDRDDLLVYADRHHDMKFPTIGFNSRLAYRIDYTWDEETKAMSFEDDYYYGRDLAFVSKNRFIYIGYNIRKNCFKFQLSDEFKYCDNQKQFMVFINGRKLSQDEFNITILKNTRPFDDLFIYTAKALHPGDKLDVFYVPYPIEGMYMFKSVDEYDTKITTEEGVLTYDIPVPYKSFLQEGGVFVLTSGTRDVGIDDTSYIVDIDTNTITFVEGTVLPETLVFKMKYKHPKGFDESGYIYLNKDKLPVPFCKELYMVFVNGKKVPNDKIYNISSDCVRITTDIKSTYDVSVMMYRDIITDLVGLMNTNTASIDQLVNSIDEQELNKLNATFNTITDTEEHFVIDAQKISIINEIVRDFWMRPGINQGVPFLYDYDTDAFVAKDGGDNWVIPAMDATQFINIIEEPEDDIIYDLDLPHPDDDPYYDKTTLLDMEGNN